MRSILDIIRDLGGSITCCTSVCTSHRTGACASIIAIIIIHMRIPFGLVLRTHAHMTCTCLQIYTSMAVRRHEYTPMRAHMLLHAICSYVHTYAQCVFIFIGLDTIVSVP